ncbi:MAG TPA: ribosome silencing factor [Candidatus Omnitrophota bacterium]|nr:ribosome silencing factor [Candidatus Omnitrophota bacterium]
MKNITSKEKARLIAKIAGEKKGEDIVLVDMTEQSAVCDWFVIVSAGSSRRIKTICDEVQKVLGKDKIFPISVEGRSSLYWVLVDFEDVVMHVFSSEMRDFYGLERLWSDAPSERIEQHGRI